MPGDRQQRARLERAQARVARARAQLAAPPDVEAELAPLRDDEVRLRVVLDALEPRASSGAAEVQAARAALAQAKERRGGALVRSLSEGALGALTGTAAAVVGGLVGAVGLYLVAVTQPEHALPIVAVVGGALAAWAAYRVGKAS